MSTIEIPFEFTRPTYYECSYYVYLESSRLPNYDFIVTDKTGAKAAHIVAI